MAARRRKRRLEFRTVTLENYSVKFMRDTYLAVDRFVVMGRAKPMSRSAAVRALLDMGFLVWKPDELPYKAILSEPVFKATRVMLRPVQVKRLAALVKLGYAEDLAFNLAMRAGIIQADAIKRIRDERKRVQGGQSHHTGYALPG